MNLSVCGINCDACNFFAAKIAAEEYAAEYEIDSGIVPYRLETIEILSVEIVETEE